MARARRLAALLARVVQDASGICLRAGSELSARGAPVRDRLFDKVGVVSREEFEGVRAMAENARTENDRLAARIEELEARQRKSAPRRRTRAKSTASARE